MLLSSESAVTYKSSRANSLESTFNMKDKETASESPVEPTDNTLNTSKDINVRKSIDSIQTDNDDTSDNIKDQMEMTSTTANDDIKTNTNTSDSRPSHRHRNHTFSSFHHIKNTLSSSTITGPDDCEVPPVPKILNSPPSLNSLKSDTAANNTTENPRKSSLGTVMPFPATPTSVNVVCNGSNNIKYVEPSSPTAIGPVSRRTSISRIFNVGRSKKTRSNSKTSSSFSQPPLALSNLRKNSIAESIEETPLVLQQQYSATSNNLPVAPQISSSNRFPHFHKPTSMNLSTASNKVEFKNPFAASPASSTANLQAVVTADSSNVHLPLPGNVRQNSWSTNGSSNPESPRTPTSTVYPHPIMIQSSNSRKSSVVLEPILATAGNDIISTEHVSFFKSTFSKKSKVW